MQNTTANTEAMHLAIRLWLAGFDIAGAYEYTKGQSITEQQATLYWFVVVSNGDTTHNG